MNKTHFLKRSKQGYELDLIRYLYFLGFPLLIVFSCVNYVNGLKIPAYIDIFSLALLSFSLVLFLKSTKQYLAKSMILCTLLVLHMMALIYGGYSNSAFFWFFIFPLVALFLFNKKTAYIWISLLFACIFVTIVLVNLSFLVPAYDGDLLYVLSLALIVEVYIVNYTQGVLLNYKEGLEKLNTQLLTTNALVDKYFLIIRTDLKGVIVDVNEAFLSLSLYPRESIVGSALAKLCSDYSESCLQKDFFSDFAKTDDYNCVVECTKMDSTPYWVDTRMAPEYDIDGKQIGFLIFQQDVTQRVELEKASITDTLTQVNNRMHFDEISRHSLDEFNRYKIITSLIICDIDNFKEVNDKYGHLKGDEVLKRIASLLKANTRESDTIARWGGEEFSVLLPQTDIHHAVAAAQKMCDVIRKYDFKLDKVLTASFGVAVTQDGDTQTSWFAHADKALYDAKESGRNKVCSFG